MKKQDNKTKIIVRKKDGKTKEVIVEAIRLCAPSIFTDDIKLKLKQEEDVNRK